MNWFERYGIVGAYFLIITFVWLVCCTSFKVERGGGSADATISVEAAMGNECIDLKIPTKVAMNGNKAEINPQFIIGIFAVAFLPLGYLLTVTSQMFYYIGFGGRQIHRAIVEMLRKDLRWRNKIGLKPNMSEESCEAIITAFERLRLWKLNKNNSRTQLEALKFLASFCTRRFDVIAINNSIILSTLLSLITVNVVLYIICGLPEYTSVRIVVFLCVCTILLIPILMESNRILANQIIEINRCMSNIKEDDREKNREE